MRIIKVDAIDSTNSFVRKFYEGGKNFDPVCVRAITQTAGRGQRGSDWVTKAGENLTFSILYPQTKLEISKHFLLSASVSMAVLEVLKSLEIADLKVKWPNDILSAKRKIGGILIENIVKTEGIVASIIGIGLNVNQTEFNDLPQAGSLKSVSNKHFDLDEILEKLVIQIEANLEELPYRVSGEVLAEYEQNMFRLNEVSSFASAAGEHFNGIIRGVTAAGKLRLEIEDSVFKTYDLKELKLLY
ncbi:biotin--[acetyl-CoA-carboxylase] ligase [Christiangramia sabulilitoris]|uniref:Biotin--[acetyl-CoA-carboxylase] ligase n=1 Tax=Christiangramia sabulilitoris TaxID=2583991 RepID=A0A550I3K4_9FLAO|nr:biotin--[acetyl-CoA-carboxylase] ligase [Christiangramia sabulilitoris]TRO65555.1 biotin--[acetyl-CoA-carboxylase] ligase [Christiangramia sabulilitoris]